MHKKNKKNEYKRHDIKLRFPIFIPKFGNKKHSKLYVKRITVSFMTINDKYTMLLLFLNSLLKRKTASAIELKIRATIIMST